MSDVEYLVNTRNGTVHRGDCSVVLRARTSNWLAPWRGVGKADHDKPCGYCLPDGLPAIEVSDAQTWAVEWKLPDHRTHFGWNRYGTDTSEEAVKATLATMRRRRPDAEWRATRTVVEDW